MTEFTLRLKHWYTFDERLLCSLEVEQSGKKRKNHISKV